MKRLEDFIQYKCAEWLRNNGIAHFHVPNAAKRAFHEAARLKAMGLVAGVHDLWLVFSGGRVVPIELKTEDGPLSEPQKRWHAECDKLKLQHYTIRTDKWEDAIKQLEVIVLKYKAKHVFADQVD